MSERTNSPTPDGPWPANLGLDQVHDSGIGWCVNATGHPDLNGGYPDSDVHVPAFECRTRGTFIDDVRTELLGETAMLEVYAARPFRFGLPRDEATPTTRLVLEFVDDTSDDVHRYSITPGEALRLRRVVDLVTYV